jgi:hypothetical protein
MNRPSSGLRRTAVGLICLAFVLVGRVAAAADGSLVADFDGDGRSDRAILERGEPSALHVWLSATATMAELRSATPIRGIAARDLDGDRRAELILGGASELEVWTSRRRGFTRFRTRRPLPRTLVMPGGRGVRRHRGEVLAAIPPPTGADALLALVPHARAPALSDAPAVVSAHSTLRPRRSFGPLAPRPPPFTR